MAKPFTSPKRANYGLDAPEVVLLFLGLGVTGLAFGAASLLALRNGLLPWTRFVVVPLLSLGGWFFLTAGVMFWGSKVGKLRLRDQVINALSWRGDERVLDVGCGHGLMLIAAAKRLDSGKAIGLDLWQKADQAGNSRDATWQNVLLEGVADKVELEDGDARKLPFKDNTFDLVLSSWALHNIYDESGREAAVREIVRVLKPGGRVTIIDIRHTTEYAQVLQEAQMRSVARNRPNFLFVIPTFAVTATKTSQQKL
jgi:ubiquinone/menaquinone biosynthesis C-methylase UbiE